MDKGQGQRRDIMADFRATVHSKITLHNDLGKLQTFFDYFKFSGGSLEEKAEYFVMRAREDALKQEDRYPRWAEECIIGLIEYEKTRLESGEITSADTVRKYIDPIQHLCQLRSVRLILDWKGIRSYLPRPEKGVGTKYRPYTEAEIRKILSYPDRRIKPIVLLMTSCGMSIGQFERLRWGDIRPIYDAEGRVTCATIHLYRGKTYYNYPVRVTPECYNAIKGDMDDRAARGELVNDKDVWPSAASTPIIRDKFRENENAQAWHYAHKPVAMAVASISDIVKKALRHAGMRPPKQEKRRTKGPFMPRKAVRYPMHQNHSFRMFCATMAAKYMKNERWDNGTFNAEMLIGHSMQKLPHFYQIPDVDEFTELYLRAVPFLTISEESKRSYESERKAEEAGKDIRDLSSNLMTQNALLQEQIRATREESAATRRDFEEFKARFFRGADIDDDAFMQAYHERTQARERTQNEEAEVEKAEQQKTESRDSEEKEKAEWEGLSEPMKKVKNLQMQRDNEHAHEVASRSEPKRKKQKGGN